MERRKLGDYGKRAHMRQRESTDFGGRNMTAPSHGPRRMNKERCRRSFVCTGWSFHGGRNEYRYGKVNDNTRTAQLPPSLCNPPPGWEGRSEGRPQSAAHEGVVQHKRATPSLMQRERREQTPSEPAPSRRLCFWPRFAQPWSRFEARRGSETTNRLLTRMLQRTWVGGRARSSQGGAEEESGGTL